MSKVFDPSVGEIKNLNLYKNKNIPFMRKILKNSISNRQKTEIEISKIIMKNPQKNIVKIYEIKLPDNMNDGYIDMELLVPLEDDKEYKINKIHKTQFHKIDNNILSGLNQLHKLYIIYIDLHIGNVGWSAINKCWKIFDFNMSGIVNNNNIYQWKYIPDNGIIFRKIINFKKYNEIFNNNNNKITYDVIAKMLFDRELKTIINK